MELERKKIQRALYFVVYALLPVGIFYLMEAYEHNALLEVRTEAQFFNIFIFELLAWIIYLAIGHMCAAARVILGIAMAFGITNHYVMKFRSTPFVPWDIFSVRTATSVAENYDFTPDLRMVIVTLIFIAAIVLSRFLKKAPKIKLQVRLGALLVSVLVTCLFVNTLQKEDFQTKHYLYPFLFTPAYMTKVNGMAVTFAMDLAYVAVERPAGYDADEAKETLAKYETKTTETDTQDLPNIIVIMDEAFSDLAVRGDFTTNEDYMPFIHRLQQGAENTRTGYLNVSVLGGNTANTEFEFLTGNTIGFLPQGSVAYQQYVQKETPSLASYLKELDYHTVAIHPYYASGWDRDRVYPLLGFDEFLSQDDFTNPKRIRNYISDESSFAKIIELYENKKEGEPLFVFNVTMQNHSGYEEEFHNFTPDITVDGIDSKALSMYLSLVKQTDSALQGLIDYFSQADEDTMIVFFGDHQPTTYVSNPILRNNKVNPETLTDEENLLKYKVPYVIWSNFDIEEQTDGETSANYLAMDVLENCDLPLPALQSSLTGLRKEYPVISAAGVREADGTLTTVKQCGEALNDYRSLEYYLLFDYER